MDFAAALHMTGSQHCEVLYSFDDRRFARRARRLGGSIPVRVPKLRASPP
jgi:hypothetical protein